MAKLQSSSAKQRNRATGKMGKQAKATVTKVIEEGRRHEFVGQHEASVVIEWLQDPSRPAYDAVEQLVALEVRFQSGNPEAGQETCSHINEMVAKWKLGMAPVAAFSMLDGRTIVQRSTADIRKVPPLQSLAFSKAVELLQAGLLTRVRRCKREGCGAWFFAVFDHAIYHSEACRIQAVSNNPEFRERRKKYMRARRKKQIGGGK
jgi:hypothetical protein